MDAIKITPNCRYDHGDLLRVQASGSYPRWGYLTATGDGLMFFGELFVCTRCGYTEFFDDEPQQTAINEALEVQVKP